MYLEMRNLLLRRRLGVCREAAVFTNRRYSSLPYLRIPFTEPVTGALTESLMHTVQIELQSSRELAKITFNLCENYDTQIVHTQVACTPATPS